MRAMAFIILVIICLTTVEIFAAEKNIDFSGEWTLVPDENAPERGRRRLAAAFSMTIGQKENELAIQRIIQRSYDEEVVLDEKLTLDGKECKSESRNMPRVSTVIWADDGKSLTIFTTMTFEWNGEEHTRKSSEVWSLEENGSQLKIEATSEGWRGEEMKQTLVYVRE